MTETPDGPEASAGEPDSETTELSEVPPAAPTPPPVAEGEPPATTPAEEPPAEDPPTEAPAAEDAPADAATAGEEPPADEAAPEERPSGGSSRRRWVLIAAALALLGGGGAAAALLLTGDEKTKPKARTAPRAIAPPPQTTSTTPAEAAVDEPAVRKLLDRYQDAYNSEDATALSELFSADVVRKGGDETQTGRDAVLAEYRKQFKVLDQPKYRLLRLAVATDPKGATATGRYQVTSANGGGQGTISFHLRGEGGRVVIDHLDAEPKP